MSPLERALAALDAGEDQAALVALVEAWRERRAPSLAELADLLDSRQMQRPFASILTFQVKSTIARLRALAESDDPRMANFILDALANPPFTSVSSRPFWQLVFDIALTLRDPRLRASAVEARPFASRRFASAPLRAHVLQGISRLESQEIFVRDATEDELRLEAEIAKHVEKLKLSKRREHELLAEIYADPYADGPRQVYADVLLERGDPRGELISLQLERHATAPSIDDIDEHKHSRERELLSRHLKKWLGPLAAVVANTELFSETRFERGFLAVAHIYDNAMEWLPLTWNAISWATVEEIVGELDVKLAVLRHAPLFALRRVFGLPIDALAIFPSRPELPYLSELEVVIDKPLDDRQRDLIARCAALPALKRLLVSTRSNAVEPLVVARWILGAPVADRLERLVVGRPFSAQQRPEPPVEELVEAALTLPATVPTLCVLPHGWRGRFSNAIEFRRDASGRYARADDQSSSSNSA